MSKDERREAREKLCERVALCLHLNNPNAEKFFLRIAKSILRNVRFACTHEFPYKRLTKTKREGVNSTLSQMKLYLQDSTKRVPSYGGPFSLQQSSGSDTIEPSFHLSTFLSRFPLALFIGLIKETRLVFVFEAKLLFLFELLQAFFWCW